MDKSYLLNFLGVDSVVLEAGAHIGTDTAELAKLFHAGKIYSFEPVKRIYSQLQQNVAHLPNVEIFNLALDERTGEKEMFISSNDSDCSSSLLEPKEHLTLHPTVHYDHKEIVQTITINDWVRKKNIPKIDFFWLDMEGNEYYALTKADQILPAVKAIYSEISYVERFKGVWLYEDYKKFLAGYGFEEVLNIVYAANNFGDVLFVRK
jgi:FkbM family methyltransferase